METLISLTTGWIGPAAAAAIAAIALLWRAYAAGQKSGRNAAKAKESDAYEQHLKDLERASNARADANRVNADPERLRENDGYRRPD